MCTHIWRFLDNIHKWQKDILLLNILYPREIMPFLELNRALAFLLLVVPIKQIEAKQKFPLPLKE